MFGSSFATDAVALLKDDHRELEALIEGIDARDEPTPRRELARALCEALDLHMQVEQRLVYPVLRRAGIDAELLDQAEFAHRTLARLLADVDPEAGDGALATRLDCLAAAVQQHIEQVEQDVLPEARRLDIDLDALGEEILALRTRLEVRAARPAAGAPAPAAGAAPA